MPTTGRYPLIQLNSIYLTTNGMAGGKPCKTRVDGLKRLFKDVSIQVIKSLNGTPYYQLSDVQAGLPIDITIDSLEQDVFDDIKGAIDDFLNDPSTPITLSVTGAPYGDFTSLDIGPAEEPYDIDSEFINTRVKNFVLHLITT
jgi:hypothetical protein